MAGKEQNGFAVSDRGACLTGASLHFGSGGAFRGSGRIVRVLARQNGLWPGGEITTAAHHDRNDSLHLPGSPCTGLRLCVQPRCREHSGFSAGSYRDVSRVARINDVLWSVCFWTTVSALIGELDN